MSSLINALENKAMVINDLAETLDKYIKLEFNVRSQKNINEGRVRRSTRVAVPRNERELKRLRNLYGNTNAMGNYITHMKADILARKEELIHMILANREHIDEIKNNKEVFKAVGRMIRSRASRVTFMNENRDPLRITSPGGAGPRPAPGAAGSPGGAGAGAGNWGGEPDGVDELANLFGRSGFSRKNRKTRKTRKTRK